MKISLSQRSKTTYFINADRARVGHITLSSTPGLFFGVVSVSGYAHTSTMETPKEVFKELRNSVARIDRINNPPPENAKVRGIKPAHARTTMIMLEAVD